MNNPSQFARLSLGAGAKGRAAELPPLRRPATIIDDQTWIRHRVGQPALGRDVSAPAHRQGRAHERFAGSSSNVAAVSLHDLPLKLGAGFGRRPFLAEGRGCNPRLAKIQFIVSKGFRPAECNRSSDNLFRHIAEHLSHSSKSSNRYAQRRSERGFARAQKPFVGAAKGYD